MQTTRKFVLILAAVVLSASAGYSFYTSGGIKSDSTPSAANKGALVPTGFGPLQLGMTKQAVEALPSQGDAFLTAPLVEKENSSKGMHPRFVSRLQSPLSEEPAEVTLSFGDGKLFFITIELEQHSLRAAEDQLTAKYGPPIVAEKTEFKKCVYQDGTSRMFDETRRDATWKGLAEDGRLVTVTSISRIDGLCLTHPADEASSYFKAFMLVIGKDIPDSPEPPKKNLF